MPELNVNADLWPDFRTASRLLLRTWDVDPMYPLLRRVYEKRDLDEETALWYTFIYVNWYWMSSSEYVFERHPEPAPLGTTYDLRCRKERRCINPRGGEPATEFMDYIAAQAPLTDWVADLTAPGGMRGWRLTREAIEEAPYAGGWASYKVADLLRYTHGYDITADDMGTGSGSAKRGPIAGIIDLTDGYPRDFKEVTDAVALQEEFYDHCLDAGIPFNGVEQLETCLCNFTSIRRQWYYVGSDLDDMMEQLDGVSPVFWEARNELFPAELLGERHGWHGKSQAVRRAYDEDGVLRWWHHGYDGRPAFADISYRAFPWAGSDPAYTFGIEP